MIYFYQGTDTEKVLSKSMELVDSLRQKKPDAGFFRVDVDNFSEASLDEYVEGQGLFSNKYIVFLDRVFSDKKTKEFFLEKLKDIKKSENIFIVVEANLDKATVGKIEKQSEKTIKLNSQKIVQKQPYNDFALADYFMRKDKKETWTLYRNAIDKGIAPEALHGMLFWKIKSILVSGYKSTWKDEELLNVLDRLIDVYYDSRSGDGDMELGVENIILSLN